MTMAIDRRALLGGFASLGATSVLPASVLGAGTGTGTRALFAAARKDRQGRFSVAIFDPDAGVELASIALPARGHDIAVRPRAEGAANASAARGCRDCIAFARRPGNFAVVFNDNPDRSPLWFSTLADRHFYGHGVFSRDGRLLFTTENDFATGRGVIGIRDAAKGYQQLGEFDAGGIGPHDLAMLSDNKTLVVANGGIRTHPETPRAKLNLSTMRPNLAYIDVTNGDLLERHDLPRDLHKLSIRHLSVGTGDWVVFGCQFKGARWETKAIIGRHKRGRDLELLALPADLLRDMRNYVASVTVDRAGEIALVSAPRGGIAIAIDVASGKYLANHAMQNVFGVAPNPRGAGFVLTSGNGGLAKLNGPPRSDLERYQQKLAAAWDNHLVAIG